MFVTGGEEEDEGGDREEEGGGCREEETDGGRISKTRLCHHSQRLFKGEFLWGGSEIPWDVLKDFIASNACMASNEAIQAIKVLFSQGSLYLQPNRFFYFFLLLVILFM